jgi:diguanylate cyclase (GGDEF)-like protein
MLAKDGSYRWMLQRGLAVRSEAGKPYRMAGSQTDITSRKLAEEQLRHDALHDALTNLPNRTLFVDRLEHAINRIRRTGKPLAAVLFLDLDRFKVINDSLGHIYGDQLLTALSKRLEACLRPSDSVARLGGDEFAILIEDVQDVHDVNRLADRLQEAISAPFHLQGHDVFTSVSIGIAISNGSSDQPEDLLRDADTAMYRAKSMGKARYEIFNSEMHASAVAMMEIEADLRRALERDEFVVYYQPITSVKTQRISGVEALVRWQHPERGLLMPKDFISIAEETGLVVAIDQWVLRKACAQNRVWRDAGFDGLHVAVNFASRQFMDPDLPHLVSQVLESTGIDPASLTLEISEATAMDNVDLSAKVMADLATMGLDIAIDDFGTAYSSLGYLKRFPIRMLKIDQSFIRDIPTNRDDTAIVKAIIGMAHTLNLSVVAEGVETLEQMRFLESEGCDELQGYLMSKPVPAETIDKLLAQPDWVKRRLASKTE